MSIFPETVSIPLCFVHALKYKFDVLYQFICRVGCDPSVVNILGAPICFHDRVKVLSNKANECWKWTVKTLCQTFVSKRSKADSIWMDCSSTTCQQWLAWEQHNLQKNIVPALCWAASVIVVTIWLFSLLSWLIKWLMHLRSIRTPTLPLGFLCAKIGEEYLLKSKKVLTSYSCNSASSTVMSLVMFVGVNHVVEFGRKINLNEC